MSDDDLLIKNGWKRFLMHDVPIGALINSETIKNFPIIETNTFVSPNKLVMIDLDRPIQDNIYRLITNDAKYHFTNTLPYLIKLTNDLSL